MKYKKDVVDVDSLIDDKIKDMTELVKSAQPEYHQTPTGRALAAHIIANEVFPNKLKDQILLVYANSGLKATLLMHAYLQTAPIVLALASVQKDAELFVAAYNKTVAEEGASFPYVRLMGRGNELNLT